MHAPLNDVRFLKSLAIGRNDPMIARGFADGSTHWGADRYEVMKRLDVLTKSAVPGLAAGPLNALAGVDFLAFIRPQLLTGRIPGIRHSPSRTMTITQVAGATAYFAGQGKAARMSVGSYVATSHVPFRVTALAAASNELIADASLGAENIILADLAAASLQRFDGVFIDPAAAAVAGANPASITNGVAPVSTSITDLASADAAIKAMISALSTEGSNLKFAAFIGSNKTLAGLSLLRGSGGAPAYPLDASGTLRLATLPFLASDACPNGILVLVDGSQIVYTDDVPTLSTSTQATLEMNSAPTGDTLTPNPATQDFVSMFQTETTALLVSLPVTWTVTRAGSVQVSTGVAL